MELPSSAKRLEFKHLSNSKKLAYCVDDVLSENECKDIQARLLPYLKVQEKGEASRPGFQKQTVLCETEKTLCQEMFEKLKKFLPGTFMPASGPHAMKQNTLWKFGDTLRLVRYYPGQLLAPHFDTGQKDTAGNWSSLTVQIYLNEGFEGGETRFLCSEAYKQVKRNIDDGDDVVPKTGRMVVFQHDVYHMGVKVTKGTKYTVRFDAFYHVK